MSGGASGVAGTRFGGPLGPDDDLPQAGRAAAAATLAIGSRGDAVHALQEQLKKLAYLGEDPDGIFGSRTQGAILDFQRQNGLSPTGTLDEATRAALANAVELGAKKPAAGAKPNEIVFVGMGQHTPAEVRDLSRRAAVLGITDARTPDKLEFKVGGRLQSYDLTKDAEIDRYVRDLGLSGAKATEAAGIIRGSGPDARDETAQVVRAFVQAERGERTIERLVLSGHSIGDGVWGDANGSFEMETMKKIAKAYPRAAGQVEDFLVAGCYSSSERHVEIFREMFPNLKTSMAYGDSAPGTWTGAMVHNARWEQATRGHDPSKLTRDIVAGTRKGDNVATWNATDGYQADGPQRSLADLRTDLARLEPTAARTFSGDAVVADTQSGPLRDSYRTIQRLLGRPDLPAADRPRLEALRDKTIRMIFYDAMVKGKYQEANGAAVRAGYQALGLSAPDFGRLSRKEALAKIADFERALAARTPKPQAAQALLPLLTGLRDLTPAAIPNNWI